ncbi:MAG: M48 family metallopeptidase [Bdellovibrionales bacterium]|nr:M48 family metallopeptidase [Bdellovibrionales bacterium]
MNQISFPFVFEKLLFFSPSHKFFPDTIELHAISKVYDVEYQKRSSKYAWHKHKNMITIYGSHRKRSEIHKQLFLALREDCKKAFTPRLKMLSDQWGLPFAKVRYKAQRTLWGSCSDLKNLNFNIRLLFLPIDLVEYVFLHELCHTQHLNHSKQFWDLVHSFEPNYKKMENRLQHGAQYLPQWAQI